MFFIICQFLLELFFIIYAIYTFQFRLLLLFAMSMKKTQFIFDPEDDEFEDPPTQPVKPVQSFKKPNPIFSPNVVNPSISNPINRNQEPKPLPVYNLNQNNFKSPF